LFADPRPSAASAVLRVFCLRRRGARAHEGVVRAHGDSVGPNGAAVRAHNVGVRANRGAVGTNGIGVGAHGDAVETNSGSVGTYGSAVGTYSGAGCAFHAAVGGSFGTKVAGKYVRKSFLHKELRPHSRSTKENAGQHSGGLPQCTS
jgi:hypothetical protein